MAVTEQIEELTDRISCLEYLLSQSRDELNKAQNQIADLKGQMLYFEKHFTRDLLVEIAERFKLLVDERELMAMTNEEFNSRLQLLLFG